MTITRIEDVTLYLTMAQRKRWKKRATCIIGEKYESKVSHKMSKIKLLLSETTVSNVNSIRRAIMTDV